MDIPGPDSAGVLPTASVEPEFVMLTDDVLTSVANATTFLLQGSEIEKLAVLFQFPQFLEHCPADTIDIMVPEIAHNVIQWVPSVQMAAAEALYYVVDAVISASTAKRICLAALKIVDTCESGNVFDAWGEILSMTLPQVTREDVMNLVVPSIQARVASHNPEARRLVARSIGSLAQTQPQAALTPDEIEELFLEAAMQLCADEDPSVRAMIAQSIASLGSYLPMNICEFHLWPKLEILLGDDNSRVRAASLRALARSAEAHASEHAATANSYQTLVAPLFRERCRRASKIAAQDLRKVDDDTYLMLEVFSEVFGYLLVSVAPVIANDETAWQISLNALRCMVTCNGPTVRHWCAYNLPAVAATCGPSRHHVLRGVLTAMAGDTDVETRATLAAGIHEVADVFCRSKLREELIHSVGLLMTDANSQVRVNALRNFSTLIRLLLQGSPSDSPTQLNQIFESLERMSQEVWRTQETLAQQLEISAPIVPQEMICDHIAPVLFAMARESTYLVRKASISALVNATRYISDVSRRDHLLEYFKNQWSQGKVYWTRVAYIDAAEVAYGLYSNSLFNQIFASELLALANDPIANVRLRVVRVFRAIAPVCSNWAGFDEILSNLSDDVDPEVQQEGRALQDDMPDIGVATEAYREEDKAKQQAEKQFFVVKRARSLRKDASSASTGKQEPIRRTSALQREAIENARNETTDSEDKNHPKLDNGDHLATGELGSALGEEYPSDITNSAENTIPKPPVQTAPVKSKSGGCFGCFGSAVKAES